MAAQELDRNEAATPHKLGEARKRGQLRQEGRGYVVQDGDVLNILFSK